jgi:predicted NBD/HSP70 family sugar kinase
MDGADEPGSGDGDAEWLGHAARNLTGVLTECQAEGPPLLIEPAMLRFLPLAQRFCVLYAAATMADSGASFSTPPGAGMMLNLIRDGSASTRAELVRHTGLARSTVAQRVDTLLAHQLVSEVRGTVSTGGRPPTMLKFNHEAGVVLVADLGATHSRLGVTDLAGAPMAELTIGMDIADGPEPVLTRVQEHFTEMLRKVGREPHAVRGIGVGVPGPVAFDTGQPVNPPIMPGWDGFSIPDWFAARYDAPVMVDNDVNIMALGEYWVRWRHVEHLLFVKAGTGIGCGIVAGGRIHRGAQGAAGDIGHIGLPDHDDVVCRCGNTGCLEAVAGGRALAQRLSAQGVQAADSRAVVELVRAGHPQAVRAVREAGRGLGAVLAGVVNFFNPTVIVLGGDLAAVHEQMLAGVREVTFQRSLPLATRDLQTVPSQLGDRAGVIGAAVMVIEQVLAPEAVDLALQRPATAA